MYYKLKIKCWRRPIPKIHTHEDEGMYTKEDQIEETYFFKENDIFKARTAAFEKYQSFIDVLYLGIGKSYVNDAQARKDLKVFFDSGNEITYLSKDPKRTFSINDIDMHNELAVYFVDENEEAHVIHSIHYEEKHQKRDYRIDEMLEGLEEEFEALEDLEQSERLRMEVLSMDRSVCSIIPTPFNWKSWYFDFKIKNYDIEFFK